jgi:hypothetical protein
MRRTVFDAFLLETVRSFIHPCRELPLTKKTMVLPIVSYDAAILTQKAKEIDRPTESLLSLEQDMWSTLDNARGLVLQRLR